MLAKSLATEWALDGIRVNILSPGCFKRDLIARLLEHEGRELVAEWDRDVPIKRMANRNELSNTIVWMVIDAGTYVPGSYVVIQNSPQAQRNCNFQ